MAWGERCLSPGDVSCSAATSQTHLGPGRLDGQADGHWPPSMAAPERESRRSPTRGGGTPGLLPRTGRGQRLQRRWPGTEGMREGRPGCAARSCLSPGLHIFLTIAFGAGKYLDLLVSPRAHPAPLHCAGIRAPARPPPPARSQALPWPSPRCPLQPGQAGTPRSSAS